MIKDLTSEMTFCVRRAGREASQSSWLTSGSPIDFSFIMSSRHACDLRSDKQVETTLREISSRMAFSSYVMSSDALFGYSLSLSGSADVRTSHRAKVDAHAKGAVTTADAGHVRPGVRARGWLREEVLAPLGSLGSIDR